MGPTTAKPKSPTRGVAAGLNQRNRWRTADGARHARHFALVDNRARSPRDIESVLASITEDLRLQMLCLVLEAISGVPVQPANKAVADVNALSAQVFTDIHNLSVEALSGIKTLSARQMVVLHGVCRGIPNKAIAFDLGITQKTVETHRARIMKKLDAGSLAELMVRVLLAGIEVAATRSATLNPGERIHA